MCAHELVLVPITRRSIGILTAATALICPTLAQAEASYGYSPMGMLDSVNPTVAFVTYPPATIAVGTSFNLELQITDAGLGLPLLTLLAIDQASQPFLMVEDFPDPLYPWTVTLDPNLYHLSAQVRDIFGNSAQAAGGWFEVIPGTVVSANDLPTAFALSGCWPNPFNPSTTVRFSLPATEMTTLEVFNLQGQRVATLINGMMEAGEHEVTFSAGSLPTGTYLLNLRSGTHAAVTKASLIK
jgi:hypothetical protein